MSYHPGRSRQVPVASGVELRTVWWEPEGPPVGSPWLLVHGLASNARLWDGVGRRLAAAGRLAVAVDQRAHGLSSKIDGPFDMGTVADDLLHLLDALGWDKANLVGQSWGGNVVIEAAVRHPDRVALVVGVDGGAIDLSTRFPDWSAAELALAPPRLAGTPLERIEQWLATSADDWPEEGRQGTLANFEVTPGETATVSPWLTFERHLSVLRGLWEHDPFERFAHVSAPLLLIGADDGTGPSDKHEAIDRAVALAPVARSVWFRPAHHDVHAQKPDEVAELLLRAADDPAFFSERSADL
ncbi:MAG: alpha/beta hydrolase [Acidimicrobiales bacterium]